MLTLDQLTRLKEVCYSGIENAESLLNGHLGKYGERYKKHQADSYSKETANATAALADIDAEIELLKATP